MREEQRAKELELIKRALATLPRLEIPVNTVREKEGIDALAEILLPDYLAPPGALKAARREAKAMFNRASKPGGTEPDRQLHLPDLEPYDWEPDRLIRDEHGHIVENWRAPFEFKVAERIRATENVDRALKRETEKRAEVVEFEKFRDEERAAGRKILDLTWGGCVEVRKLRR